jgi:hypothetical protein
MHPEIQHAVDLLQTGDEQAVEQALTLLQERYTKSLRATAGSR